MAQGIIDERTGQIIPLPGPSVYAPAPTGNTPMNTTPGGPATSPSPTAAGGDGMTPYGGFAGQYAPGSLKGIYENPWYILPDVFSGVDMASPLYQTLRDINADPLALYNLIMGANQTFNSDAQGDAAFTNWLAQMYQNLGTAGGKGFDVRQMLANLFAQDTSKDSESALNAVLRSGDVNQQVRFLYNLVRDATNVGMNPLAAAGYQSAMARQLDAYGNDVLRGDSGQNLTPLEWVKRNAPQLVIG